MKYMLQQTKFKMGASITLHSKDDEIFFRDAYNLVNLAWVINESYWIAEDKDKDKIEFMKKLSKITDEQIEKRIEQLLKEDKTFNEDELRKVLKDKRDRLKEIFESYKIIKVAWSV